MEGSMVVVVALAIGVPLFLALVIGIIVVAGRSRPQAGLGPTATTPGGPASGGTWNAQILSDGLVGDLGGTLGALAGTFRIGGGRLSFTAQGAAEPAWVVPCDQVTARAHSAFSTAGVDLWMPERHVRCNVSREHVNVWVRNSIKSLREARYYREFVDILVLNGARPG